MVHWATSYAYGKAKELDILPLLRAYFGRDIQQYPNQYDDFDFYDEFTEYEVKSRTNAYAKYPTTMITKNKTEKTTSKKVILLFNFTDGLYYIKYEPTQFSKYETRKFSRAGEKWDEKLHIYIPIKDLKKIEEGEKCEEDLELPKSVGGISKVIEEVIEEPKTYTILHSPVQEQTIPIYKIK